jgi:hypothetical protein
MIVRFKSRISGCAEIAWKQETLHCAYYELIPPGTVIELPNGESHATSVWGIKIDGGGTWELKPKTFEVLWQ